MCACLARNQRLERTASGWQGVVGKDGGTTPWQGRRRVDPSGARVLNLVIVPQAGPEPTGGTLHLERARVELASGGPSDRVPFDSKAFRR